MSERIQRQRDRAAQPQREPDAPLTRPETRASDYDAILDEIDAVLESDAEDYVRGFVQKGGQ